MLQEYIRLNKNILLAFAASLVVSAVVAQALYEQEDYLNAAYTAAADYAVYFSVFSLLFYLDNRRRYRNADGTTDRPRLRRDLRKLVASLGIAEIVYTVARWLIQYYLLIISYDPYLASIISHIVSTIIYMGVVNLGMIATRLYRDDN